MTARLARCAATLALLWLTGCAGFGQQADGERLDRMQRSPQWRDGVFANPQPLWNDTSVGAMLKIMFGASPYAKPVNPSQAIPRVRPTTSAYATPPASGLRVTWFGHSSLLIEIDGKRVLTDPVWGPTTSPVTWAGPERWYPPLIELADLPPVDVVLISHDHYDHLDHATFTVIKNWPHTTFVVPLGVGAHLEHWGVPPERIVELDWWEAHTLDDLRLTCAPARHASGRGVFDQDHTLWASWALHGPRNRVYFSGDTGLFDDLQRIGERLGPFDLTLIEVGAYDRRWPDWHLGPEQAVLAHQWVRGARMLPIHWGLFDMALHSWTEPAERVLVAARQARVDLVLPVPGQPIEPATAPRPVRWWPHVPWETAAEHPIVANSANGRPPHAD